MRCIVIGAGPAGLASAACLMRAGIETEVLERGRSVGESWRDRYERLHLHTPRSHSGLPFRPMPRDWPTYPSREMVVRYLEDYAEHFGIAPRFGTTVRRIAPENGGWRVETQAGAEEADVVVCATGLNARPYLPDWPGLEGFPGPVVHSAGYRNPEAFSGRVLVVGFGNSGAEIALDLCEAGRAVEVSVRGPVNVVPRDLFGVPVLSLNLLQRLFGHRVADRIAAPVLRRATGDIARLGLRPSAKGPASQIVEDGRIPVLDVGTLARIRDGSIRLRPGVDRFDGAAVAFADGSRAKFDALVLATGYRTGLEDMLRDVPGVLRANGRPVRSGAPAATGTLYFCGYTTRPTGQFRTNAAEAQAIATEVAARRAVA